MDAKVDTQQLSSKYTQKTLEPTFNEEVESRQVTLLVNYIYFSFHRNLLIRLLVYFSVLRYMLALMSSVYI